MVRSLEKSVEVNESIVSFTRVGCICVAVCVNDILTPLRASGGNVAQVVCIVVSLDPPSWGAELLGESSISERSSLRKIESCMRWLKPTHRENV